MPGSRDRYKPLREAARQAQDRQSPQQEEKNGPHEQRAAEAHATREIQAEIAEEGPTRPPDNRPRSPGWTSHAPMPDQFTSALKYDRWVNSSHNQRPEVPQQAPESGNSQQMAGERSSLDFNVLQGEHSKALENKEASAEQTREAHKQPPNSVLGQSEETQRRIDAKAAIQRAGAEINQPAHTHSVARTPEARPGQDHQPQTYPAASRDMQQQDDGTRGDSALKPDPEIQRRRDAKTTIENDITPAGSERSQELQQRQPELATNERTTQRSGRDDDR